ncbi:hypothetical protein N2152v2_008792 [Parachlorella kessleri]
MEDAEYGSLVPSQEPQLPIPHVEGDARTRVQTRKSKVMEQTTQQEETPEGDQVEVREIRQVTEVTKRVAVVKPGTRRRSKSDDAEAAAEDGEHPGDQGRKIGRRSTRARLDEELDRAMHVDLTPAGGAAGAATPEKKGGRGAGGRREVRTVIIEGDEAAPEGEEGAGAVEGSPAAAAGEVPLEGEGEEEAAPQPRKGRGRPPKKGKATSPRGKGAARKAAVPAAAEEADEAEEAPQQEQEAPGGEMELPQTQDLDFDATPADLGPPSPRHAAPEELPSADEVPEAVGQDLMGPPEVEEEARRRAHDFNTAQEDEEAAPPAGRGGRKRKAPGAGPSSATQEEQAGGGARSLRARKGAAPGSQAKASTKPKSPRTPAGKLRAVVAGALRSVLGVGAEEQPAEEEAPAPEPAGPAEAPEEELPEAPAVQETEVVFPAPGEDLQALGIEPLAPEAAEAAVLGEGVVVAEEGEEEEEEEEEEVPAPTAAAAPQQRRSGRGRPAKAAGSTKGKGGAAGRKAGPKKKRGKARKNETYKRYIYRVLKQIHPEMGISSRAMQVCQSFMEDAYEKIMEEAQLLTLRHKRATLTSREIQAAVSLVLPGELARHAMSEGKKAVARSANL